MCVCLLHNSKTIKPNSLKLCMHTKKTPRKCKSENWVFRLIKTSLLKKINIAENPLCCLLIVKKSLWPVPSQAWLSRPKNMAASDPSEVTQETP